MKVIDKLKDKKAQVGAAVTAVAVSANANAAVEANAIISKLNENFTTAELVGIAVVGGFATLFVFKLIKRML